MNNETSLRDHLCLRLVYVRTLAAGSDFQKVRSCSTAIITLRCTRNPPLMQLATDSEKTIIAYRIIILDSPADPLAYHTLLCDSCEMRLDLSNFHAAGGEMTMFRTLLVYLGGDSDLKA